MSAAMKMSAAQLRRAARALELMSAMANETGARLAVYGRTDLSVDGTVVSVSWDEAEEQYRVDDRVGD